MQNLLGGLELSTGAEVHLSKQTQYPSPDKQME